MNKDDYQNNIIIPVLQYLDPEIPFTENAVNLILLTAIAESNLTYLEQLGGGPACGLLQMEPETELSLWDHYLRRKPDLAKKVSDLMINKLGRPKNLTGNLYYQVAMARVKYWPDPMRMPNLHDIDGICNYYIRIYNGGGKAKFETVRQIYTSRVLMA